MNDKVPQVAGKRDSAVSESTLLKLAVSSSFDAAKAIANLSMMKVGSSDLVSEWVMLETEEDFDLLHHNDNVNWPEDGKKFNGYSLEMLTNANKAKVALGKYYKGDGQLTLNEVKELLEPLRNVPVKKRYMNRLDDPNPAEVVSFPFNTLLKSIEAHPERWNETLEKRRESREL